MTSGVGWAHRWSKAKQHWRPGQDRKAAGDLSSCPTELLRAEVRRLTDIWGTMGLAPDKIRGDPRAAADLPPLTLQ
eukprot:1580143-Pyramimonas_sp.AAC.1